MRSMPLLHPYVPAGRFELSELLEYEPPVRWRPEEGEQIQGTLIKIEERSAFGRSAPTMFILIPPEDVDEHEHRYVTVRASGIVLKGAVHEREPGPGEEIAVKYEGQKTTTDGSREYAMHRLAVKRRGRWVRSS